MATKQALGHLVKVNLLEVWEKEARDFTPWLAEKENIKLLSEVLNIDLELEAQEKNVGPFKADILCKDTLTGNWVLIENQIARTDHTHLGQIITYAAGLKAVTIVWIADNFTDEHRAALDWLNEITDETINFFGLEIELWRIGDSLLAPKFNIISQPNNWSQIVGNIVRGIEGNLTETQQVYLDYWNRFSSFLHERNSILRPQKPFPQNWMNFAIGRTNYFLNAGLNSKEKKITVSLILADDLSKKSFDQLEKDRNKIEANFGGPLEWRKMVGNKESMIVLTRQKSDPLEKDQWPEYQAWMATELEKLYKVFSERVKNLNTESLESDEG